MAHTPAELSFGDLLSALTRAYAQGMASGNSAASVDNPTFLGSRTMIAAAWEWSCGQGCGLSLAEQEEYFVGWVHGYVVRAEQIEGAPTGWEDAVEGDDWSAPTMSGRGCSTRDDGVPGGQDAPSIQE